MDRDERLATTRTGSIPGHTSADLAFNFVMLDALQEVAGRLRGEGLIGSVQWYPEEGPFGGLASCAHRLHPCLLVPWVGRAGCPRACKDGFAVLTSPGIIRIAGELEATKDRSPVGSQGQRTLGCSRPSQARRKSDVLATRGHPGACFAYCDPLQALRGDNDNDNDTQRSPTICR